MQAIRNAVQVYEGPRHGGATLKEKGEDYPRTSSDKAIILLREHVEALIEQARGDEAVLYWLLQELRTRYPINSPEASPLESILDAAADHAKRPPVKLRQ